MILILVGSISGVGGGVIVDIMIKMLAFLLVWVYQPIFSILIVFVIPTISIVKNNLQATVYYE